ncbi:type III-B CRISPR module RAMP protein Cmr1 [Athalassotoga saccharophila]|uniref:type III-B CRISPR module RAMP protein Cmr1 n=1 Tax=Athalassotoga saccharophila TaxID=1441386 RepID=UPI00137A6B0E|nr:type III-B CRISPR module RAMP protein Cmr1 [Athalassotoga saccharophila]BBJ28672.1 RAMP protein [Athalassotoga saccharophila]
MKSYECEIISPMFAHGADPKAFELRATEIKGGLRFWFRTALSSKLKDNIPALKFIESYIFGDTSQKSKVIISVDSNLSSKSTPIQGQSFRMQNIRFSIDPIKYLAFGMYETLKIKVKDKTIRKEEWKSYADSGTFKINFSFFSANQDGSLNQKEVQRIESIIDNVIFLYSTFGGIGARTDKGFGSFQIKSIQFNPANSKDAVENIYQFNPANLAQMSKDAVENIYQKSKEIFESINPKERQNLNFNPVEFKGLPTYPFFDPQKSITFGAIELSGKDYNQALSMVGQNYYKLRRSLEKDSYFKSAYTNPHYKAKRALLGLPILYLNQKPRVTLDNSTGRKTSPLHMNLKKYNSKYYMVYAFLEAAICSDGKLIAIEKLDKNKKEDKESNENKKIVNISDDFNEVYKKFGEIWGLKQ